MIIGYDASRAFLKSKTGTENYSFQLLKALAKIDRKNKYIVYIRPVIPAKVIDSEVSIAQTRRAGIQKTEESHGSRVRSGMIKQEFPENFIFKTINWPGFWTQGGLSLQTFKDKLDVLFVPSHTLPLIRKPGLKTVVTVHDLGSEFLPQMHQLKQRLYLGLMQKFQLKTATKIIAVSKATKEDLVKRIGLDPEKVEVVYEGYDKSLYKQVKGDLLIDRLRYYEIEKYRYFLFVGTVQPRKNLERVIEAFSHVISSSVIPAKVIDSEVSIAQTRRAGIQKTEESHGSRVRSGTTKTRDDKLRLVIAGSKGWLSDEIYALPKKLGIEDRIKFLGYVPDEDLPALYSGAIAFVYPSLFEGFGLPILEAQACGCPVITSNISSMPEVAASGAVFVDPYSIDDIVKGMKLVQSSKFRFQSVKAGFENIKRFSWDKTAKETLTLLEKTAG